MMIKMTEQQRSAFLKTVAHLSADEQAVRLAHREQSFAAEQSRKMEAGLRRDGVEVGFGLKAAVKDSK
jgi:hypothetical protein